MIQVIHNTYECDREYVLTEHYCRHTNIVGGNCMGNYNRYRRNEEETESKRMCYLGEEEKSYAIATECVYLMQRTMYGAA